MHESSGVLQAEGCFSGGDEECSAKKLFGMEGSSCSETKFVEGENRFLAWCLWK